MTSYNHLQHAPGNWQQQQQNGGDPRAMSLDSGDLEERDAKMSASGAPPQSLQQPPPQTQTLYSTATVNVEEGAWRGVVSIPRAVSQDESDVEQQEMSVSYGASSSSQTYSSRSGGNSFTSPSTTTETIPEHQEAPLSPLPLQQLQQQQQHQNQNVSSLTQERSTSTSSSSLSFAGMGRYFDTSTTDANGTAYFSAAGSGSTTLHSDDNSNSNSSQGSQQRTPPTTAARQHPYILETSVAISLSPSPVRSVGDIFQNTSLTPARISNIGSVEETVEQKMPSADNLQQLQSSSSLEQPSSALQDYSSCQSTSLQPSQQKHSSSGEHLSATANNQVPSSWGSTIHQITDTEHYTSSMITTNGSSHPPPSNHHPSGQESSAVSHHQHDDSSSWAKVGHNSHQIMSSISHDISSFQGSSSNVSRTGLPLRSSSSSNTHDSHPNDNNDLRKSWNGDDGQQNNRHEDVSPPSSKEDTQQQDLHSLNSDPLYQLQQLSHPTASLNNNSDTSATNGQQKNPLLSPLPLSSSVTANNKDDTSVNVSLGHYLSSCSTSAQTSRDEQDTTDAPKEPREGQDQTVLSDIDVSAWTQEEDSLPPQQEDQDEVNHHQQEQEYARDKEEDRSQLSGLSLQASEPSLVVTTPRKTNVDHLHLDPDEFASPTTTTKRNSIDVALDESTGYVARIEALQAELIQKDGAMNELRAHYEEQLEQLHQFTLPLQPHSPFDAKNNTKYSPGTQNKKLIERNETLAKEVRFADQTCVELSGRNTALEETLELREKELDELRQEREDLTQKLLNSNNHSVSKVVDQSLLQQLQRAKEHKLALEQQLHSAYDKLDERTKDMQVMRDEHASELFSLRQRMQGEQKGQAERLKEHNDALSFRCDEQHRNLESKEQDIQQLVSEREQLCKQLEQLSGRMEGANSGFSKSQEELKNVNQQMEALRRESNSTNWKLQETEQRLQEIIELKERETTEKKRIQEQSEYWKSQAEILQKELDEGTKRSSTNGMTGQAGVSEHILERAQQSEQEYRRVEKQFTSQVEKDLAEVHSALSALATQFEALGENSTFDQVRDDVGDSNKAPATAKPSAAKINPSLISHFLSSPSQSTSNEVLSPQVIQVLQLILSFTQQHLDVLDKKVATVTTEYGARLTRLYELVDHIRSSLVFETESDDSSPFTNNDGSRANGTSTKDEDNMLDATFAAVTSIPDKKVELMEEARSPQKPAPLNIEILHDLSSPARDTILDLSKIEAVNSPFYSSEITFSLGSEGGHHVSETLGDKKQANSSKGRARNLGLQSVQKNVFIEPLESGRKELERLGSALSTFQKGFWLQRERISSFVENQQKALRDLGAEYSSLGTQESQLVKEKSMLKSELTKTQQAHRVCLAEIERCTLDLEAAHKSESRLRSQCKSSSQRIASLEQDVVDMEDRLLNNGPQDKKSPAVDNAKDPHQLRRELADAVKSRDSLSGELKRLQIELQDLDEAHGKLKISYAKANDKLATALERAENHQALAEELNATKQQEARTRDELSLARREMQEKDTLVKSLGSEKAKLQGEKERIEKRLQNLHHENTLLKDKYEVVLSSYDGTAQEQSSLQAELAATKHELERVNSHFKESLNSAEEKLRAAIRESQDLRNKLTVARRQKEEGDEEIQRLEEAERLSEESVEELKRSYATSQNQLAEALERMSEYDKLVSEKESLESRLHEDEESKVVAAQQELEQLRGEKEDLELRLAELKDKDLALQEASQEAMALRAELADVTRAKEDSAAESDRLQQDLTQTEQALEKLKLSYVDCQEKAAEAEERAAGLEGLDEEVNRLRETELQLQQEISAANDELKAKMEALTASEATNSEICRQLDEFKTKLDVAEKEVEKSREALVAVEQVPQMQEAMQKLEDEMGRDLKDAYRRNECLSEALKQSDETLEQLKMSYLKVNDQLAEKETLLEELKSASEAAEHLASYTEDQLMDCRNELEELRNDKIDLANALAEAEDEIIAATEEFCEFRQSSETQLQDEKVLSEELADKLRETRSKLDFASAKIEKLNTALEEERAFHHEDQRKYFWSESARGTAQERFEMALGIQEEDVGRLVEIESQYMDLSSKFARVTEELESKEQALVELQSQKQVWQNRCYKLREYMRKLTLKLQEWEQFCEKLQAKQMKTKRPSTGKHSDDVHDQLEEQLNQIAIELSQVCW